MEHDDVQVGRLLTRREALTLIGVSGTAILTGSMSAAGTAADSRSQLPSCVVRPQQTEGP